jgi:hypothetical protein
MASIEAPERKAAKRRAMPKVIPHSTPAERAEMGNAARTSPSSPSNARI